MVVTARKIVTILRKTFTLTEVKCSHMADSKAAGSHSCMINESEPNKVTDAPFDVSVYAILQKSVAILLVRSVFD